MTLLSLTHAPCSILPYIPVLLMLPRFSLHARLFELFHLWHPFPVHLPVLIDQPTAQYSTEHCNHQTHRCRDPHSFPVKRTLAFWENVRSKQRTTLSHRCQNRIPARPLTLCRMNVRYPR